MLLRYIYHLSRRSELLTTEESLQYFVLNHTIIITWLRCNIGTNKQSSSKGQTEVKTHCREHSKTQLKNFVSRVLFDSSNIMYHC